MYPGFVVFSDSGNRMRIRDFFSNFCMRCHFCNLILNGLENEFGGGWEGHKCHRRQESTLRLEVCSFGQVIEKFWD